MGSFDLSTFWVFTTLLLVLTAATVVGQMLRRQTEIGVNPAVVEQFNMRVRSWWMLTAMLAFGFLLGPAVTVALFGALSFWALREFITLTPTRIADHRTLFWVFFVFTPLQFYLVAARQYEIYSILIPVYAFLFIPARIALAGDFKRYLERCTTIQTGLMICVYCLSYAPALQSIALPSPLPARLLLFFFIIVALSDAFHYVCEKLLGKHLIAPAISQNKTWEGFLGGLGCASLAGMALYWASPFQAPQAAMMAALISAMGYCGGLTMSAIKRDRGVQDYGTLLVGHSGVLDRIDSICFAAPVFYHATKYLVNQGLV
ncbi:MAG: phosphatidate cytidylyltransferase [Planctomycetales bacterium]|jgi:phosphatidate cytidylyltransferase|nr:phosphatidate cytidylyltransferase [Planctomycetales bacterium]MBN8625003.1 phosphatidate cytidylyltransferase [Planctomycetota bacterium]